MVALTDKQRIKLYLSIVLFVLAIPISLISVSLPTATFRDTWFYATVYVARGVLASPGLPTTQFQTEVLGHSPLFFWGGIGTDLTKPLEAITQATFVTVLGIDIHWLWIIFPSYIFRSLLYFVIIRRYTSTELALTSAAIGGILPTRSVVNMLKISSLDAVVLLLGIYLLILDFEDPQFSGRPQKVLSLTGVALCGLFSYFHAPIAWGILTGTTVLLVFAHVILSNHKSQFKQLSVALLLFYPIIDLLAGSNYGRHLIIGAQGLVALSNGEFSLFSAGGSGTPETMLAAEYYGAFAALLLLPFGIIGGVLIVRRVLDSKQLNSKYMVPGTVLIAWGIVIVGVMAMQLFSGSYFLVIRSYGLAMPLVVIATPIGLKYLADRIGAPQILLVLILTGGITGVFVLQTTTPHQDINTYNHGTESYTDWTTEYATGLILTDMKAGSPLVAEEYMTTGYPKKESNVKQFLYTRSYNEYCRYLGEVNPELVVLYQEMAESGLYVPDFPRKPISGGAYNMRINRTDLVYTNGEYTITNPSSKC